MEDFATDEGKTDGLVACQNDAANFPPNAQQQASQTVTQRGAIADASRGLYTCACFAVGNSRALHIACCSNNNYVRMNLVNVAVSAPGLLPLHHAEL